MTDVKVLESVFVKITQKSVAHLCAWYNDSWGKTFEVYDYDDSSFVLKEDYDNGNLILHCINKQDCKLINS